jgi:hypothetical protein
MLSEWPEKLSPALISSAPRLGTPVRLCGQSSPVTPWVDPENSARELGWLGCVTANEWLKTAPPTARLFK